MNHLNSNRSTMTRYCCINYKCRLNVAKMSLPKRIPSASRGTCHVIDQIIIHIITFTLSFSHPSLW